MILVFSSNELDFLILQNGKDGVPADSKYIWVKYSQNADGSNLTDNPSGAIYIGIAYNMDSQEESNDPSDYSWTKIKGENGEDAYTIILGNENISFSVGYDSNTVLSDQSYFSTVQIMQGVTERTDFTIGSVSSANGITITKNDQNKTLVLSVHEGDTITADSGYFRIPISIDGLIFFKDLSWNLTKQGRPGDVGHPGEGAINVIVANESQTIACTNDGLTSENALINIPFVAFKGLEKVPCSAIVGVLPSGITLGSNTSSTADEDGLIIFNVAAKSDLGGANILSGYVNLTFTVEDQTIIKRFIWTKTKDGKDGNTYTLELSSVIINKNYDGTISPTSITLRAYYQNRNERIPYAGRFIIAQSYFDDIFLTDENKNILVDENNNLLLFQEGSDGYTSSGYQNVYVSSQNESEYTHTLPPLVSGVICYLCEADSVTNILDQQTVTVLTVADDIKPIITEITTTMSGVSQKVDAVEKSITDKVWQTDITNALNNYDGTTIKTLRDQVSQINISIDGITSEVSDVKSTLTTKADGSVVQELSEKVSKVEQDAEGFKQTVEENYVTNDKLDENSKTLRSEFNQTASEINQSVTDLSGNVTTITQNVASINQEVTDAEDNISSLQQTSNSLQSQIESAQGDISNIQQTATGLQSQITNNKNDISQLEQDVEGFKTTVSSQLGDLETNIEQTAEDIELSVSEVSDNLRDNYYNKTETDALIQLESDSITSSVKESISSEVEKIEIGGRNLIKNSNFAMGTDKWNLEGGLTSTEGSDDTFSTYREFVHTSGFPGNPGQRLYPNVNNNFTHSVVGNTYTLSFYARTDEDATTTTLRVGIGGKEQVIEDFTLISEWKKFAKTYTNTETGSISFFLKAAGTYQLTNVKLEVGNKATDWTPAPEDMATADEVENAQTSADKAQSTADSTESRITVAESTIQQLSDAISTLVVDENGESMMTQTSEGWRFDMGSINSQLNDAKDQLNNLAGTVNQVDETIGNLNDLANDLSEKTAYITMTTDDSGNPCIELGKSDNDFKVRITNTSIDFMEGSSRIAYLSNSSLYIERAIIKNELQIGEETGYIWKKRSNNHMGLRWLGG